MKKYVFSILSIILPILFIVGVYISVTILTSDWDNLDMSVDSNRLSLSMAVIAIFNVAAVVGILLSLVGAGISYRGYMTENRVVSSIGGAANTIIFLLCIKVLVG